jgi:hypothetical protein
VGECAASPFLWIETAQGNVEVWALGEDRFAVRAPGHEQIVTGRSRRRTRWLSGSDRGTDALSPPASVPLWLAALRRERVRRRQPVMYHQEPPVSVRRPYSDRVRGARRGPFPDHRAPRTSSASAAWRRPSVVHDERRRRASRTCALQVASMPVGVHACRGARTPKLCLPCTM